MIVKSLYVENFGSYPHFAKDFTDEGLILIYGATGSGKSTFLDMIPWILYGVTAKDGNVDEVRSWQSPGEPTKGTVTLEINHEVLHVTRLRGKAGQNDLYWTERADTEEHRGKDLMDTQKLLEARYGLSAKAFLDSSYFHEFSPTGSFWTASAKDRRKLFEGIAPLEFPAQLATKASDARKEAKKTLEQVELAIARAEGRLEHAKASRDDSKRLEVNWGAQKEARATELATKAVRFETDRAMEIARLKSCSQEWQTQKDREIDRQVDELMTLEKKIKKSEDFDAEIRQHTAQSRCPACQSLPLSANAGIMQLQQQKTANTYNVKAYEQGKGALKNLDESENPYAEGLQLAKDRQNTYLEQVATIQAETNPFTPQVKKLVQDAKNLETELRLGREGRDGLVHRVSSLTQIYDYSFVLRGQMLLRAVQSIEEATNAYLDKYFDGEIRVGFSLEGSDTLEVAVQKGGHDCVYRQLSKGQRGLLKLCFGVAVMEAVGDKAGTSTNMLMFDESLDGLDESLKVRAHGLFAELAARHPSVYLIDHSPGLQNMLDRRYHVTLRGDASELTPES